MSPGISLIKANDSDMEFDSLAKQNALRESEERYEHLVELSPDAIIVHTDGEVTFCNTAAAQLVGAASTTELIGQSVFDYVAHESHDIMHCRSVQLRNGESPPAIEFKCLRQDGSFVDVEMRSVSLGRNGPTIQAVVFGIHTHARVTHRQHQPASGFGGQNCRKPEPGAFAYFFGGEERLKNAFRALHLGLH